MWKQIEQLKKEYLALNLQEVIDYEKFSMISITYHSTKIEGCSLTEADTKILLEKGITAKGKPLIDHLMAKDHFAAINFLKETAITKRKFSLNFLKEVAALVMKNTGGVVKTISGEFDTAKGDFRLAQVYVGNKYFPDFKKVPNLLDHVIRLVNEKIDSAKGSDILKLSADIHYHLVNIHPFGDGNGRTSRLFMNYIQMYKNEPLIKIFAEDRAEYIDALNRTETENDISIFRNFICSQQIKFLKTEIDLFKKKGGDFSLLL